MAYAMSIWNQTGKQFACATETKRKITKYRGVLEKPSEIQIPLKVEGYVKEWEGTCVCVSVRMCAKAAYHTTYLLGDPVLRLFQYITSYPKCYSGSDGTHRYSDNPLGFWLL